MIDVGERTIGAIERGIARQIQGIGPIAGARCPHAEIGDRIGHLNGLARHRRRIGNRQARDLQVRFAVVDVYRTLANIIVPAQIFERATSVQVERSAIDSVAAGIFSLGAGFVIGLRVGDHI